MNCSDRLGEPTATAAITFRKVAAVDKIAEPTAVAFMD